MTPENLSPETPPASVPHGAGRRARARSEATYEFRTVVVDKQVSRSQTRKLLTDEAEYGRWELARTRLFAHDRRVITLRRKIIRVASTLETV